MLSEGKKSILKQFFGLIAFLFHSLLVFYIGPNENLSNNLKLNVLLIVSLKLLDT